MWSQQLSNNSLVIIINDLITKHESFANPKSTLTTLSKMSKHHGLLLLFLEPMDILSVTVEQTFEKDLFSLRLWHY